MKNFILVLLVGLLSVLTFPDAAAQLINVNDYPTEIGAVTSYEGSSNAMTLKYINFILYFLGLIGTLGAIIIGSIGLILLCFKKTRKAGKIMSFIGLGAIGIVILTIVGFALVNTLMSRGY